MEWGSNGTALSFKIELKYPKDVYFIAKMPNFAHSDAEAPPSVFLYHMNKIFLRGGVAVKVLPPRFSLCENTH